MTGTRVRRGGMKSEMNLKGRGQGGQESERGLKGQVKDRPESELDPNKTESKDQSLRWACQVCSMHGVR